MNKSDLIKHISTQAELSKSQSEEALNAILCGISNTLASGDDVTLIGFGSFKVSQRAARTGRNPKTGEPISIAANRIPSFKAGKALKDALQF
ncbi:HU family DNA-binding protein [Vibrio sp. OPT18]|uniref:HU family DNA-binding protein n=1 Tax=Vibrio sp. OPT18 TaxID=2778641 RepID=UPI00188079C5|nr:HU family DNA-binding protein [Vibrio sp. OPT18]MBE8574084.1 HU family DNA-binding protein [Vibrio sp. OPT18]